MPRRDRLRRAHLAETTIRHVAVISDGSAPAAGQWGRPLESALARDVALLEGLAGIPVRTHRCAHRVDEPTIEQVRALIAQLPESVAAVFLTRTDPARSRALQQHAEHAGGPPVLTDEDTRAIALAAATTLYLRRIGRDPRDARILVTDANTLPTLAPLLVVVGIGDIALWNSADAPRFALSRAARDADVVLHIGPTADTVTALDMDRPDGSVIRRASNDDRLLAAPALLRALVEHPPASLQLDVGLFSICAWAIATATPDRRSHTCLLHDQQITDAVAVALDRTARPPDAGNTSGELHPHPGRRNR